MMRVFLNVNLEQEAFEELEMFEKKIKFEQIVGLLPQLTSEEVEAKVKQKGPGLASLLYQT